MKKILIVAIALGLLLLCGCSNRNEETKEQLSENVVVPEFTKDELDKKFGSEEIYIVKTYIESPYEEFGGYLDEGKIFTKVKHYQLSDGSWKTDDYSYKYKLELKGRMHNAAKDSTFIILSNSDDITFDMAWKASGLSSNMDDYFKPEDAIIVGIG